LANAAIVHERVQDERGHADGEEGLLRDAPLRPLRRQRQRHVAEHFLALARARLADGEVEAAARRLLGAGHRLREAEQARRRGRREVRVHGRLQLARRQRRRRKGERLLLAVEDRDVADVLVALGDGLEHRRRLRRVGERDRQSQLGVLLQRRGERAPALVELLVERRGEAMKQRRRHHPGDAERERHQHNHLQPQRARQHP